MDKDLDRVSSDVMLYVLVAAVWLGAFLYLHRNSTVETETDGSCTMHEVTTHGVKVKTRVCEEAQDGQ